MGLSNENINEMAENNFSSDAINYIQSHLENRWFRRVNIENHKIWVEAVIENKDGYEIATVPFGYKEVKTKEEATKVWGEYNEELITKLPNSYLVTIS
tara:strand:+ start:4438 stop:4731 length:294 start_codon:yes stop_codon:yes gene_type:complete